MRYMPHTPEQRAEMLEKIGVSSVDDLFVDIPEEARMQTLLDLPSHATEMDVDRKMAAYGAKSTSPADVPSFLGAGAYRHHVPSVVDHLIQRSEFLTAYTPYQPEISQGTLQTLFEFQTQVAALTGMDVANASMYDGSTACSEAVQMAHRVTRRTKAVLSGNLHPHYRAVIETNSKFAGDAVVALEADVAGAEDLAAQIDGETSCVVVQYPDFFGNIQDLSAIAAAAHEQGALLIVAIPEIVSMGALRAPGEMGADIVVAEGQSIGNPLNFGGPYVGLFATRQKYVRQMPGRLAGETVDADGRRGYVLTLSTREQHIRREKATSNICTNSGLCCLAFTIHLSLLGEQGFTRLAALNHESACKLAGDLEQVAGVDVLTQAFFNEFTIRTPKPAVEVIDALAEKGVLGGVPTSRLMPGNEAVRDLIIVAATEVNTDADRAAYKAALAEVLS